MFANRRALALSVVCIVFWAGYGFAQPPRPGPNSDYTRSIRLVTEDAQPRAAQALQGYTWGNGQTIDTNVPISYEFDRGGSLFGRWDGTSVIIYPVAFSYHFNGANGTAGDFSAVLFMTLIHEYLHQRFGGAMDNCGELQTKKATVELVCTLLCDSSPDALTAYLADNKAALCKFLQNRVDNLTGFDLKGHSCDIDPASYEFCCSCCDPPVEANGGCGDGE